MKAKSSEYNSIYKYLFSSNSGHSDFFNEFIFVRVSLCNINLVDIKYFNFFLLDIYYYLFYFFTYK